MANRQTYDNVIKPGYNPNNFQNYSNTYVLDGGSQANKNAVELREQNQRLRMMIRHLQQNKPRYDEEEVEEGGKPLEFNKRIQYNAEKIRDLQAKINEQQEVMRAYQERFYEFEDNLGKVMRLDKDIHSKLVNPEKSTTLEKNVRQAILALNSGASPQQVLGMLDQIRI